VNQRARWIEQAASNTILMLAVALLVLPVVGVILPLFSLSDLSRNPPGLIPIGSRQLILLARSVFFSGAVAAAAVAIGAKLAWILGRSRMGNHVLALFLPPLVVVPPAIHGINWTSTILAVGEWLYRHGWMSARPQGWIAAGLVEVIAYLPIAVALAWAGYSLLDVRLLEAGRVFRPDSIVERKIARRLSMPVLSAGAGVLFLLSLSDYSIPSVFSVSVYALEIFSTYSTGIHPAAAVFTAAPLVGVILFTLIAGIRVGRKAHAIAFSRRAVPASPGEGFQGPATTTFVAAAILVIHFCLPLIAMAVSVRSWRFMASVVMGARSEFAVSLQVAATVSALSLLFGFAVGRALSHGGRAAFALWIVTCLAFALPAPLIGIGIVQMGGRLGWWAEDLLPIWAGLTRFLPIAALVSYALLRRIDEGLLEAARVFARSRCSALLQVALPLVLPGLAVSAAACFSFTMGELASTILVAAPGRATLMMRLYNLLHYGASREAAALCLLLALPALLAGALLTLLLYRRAARPRKELYNA
jgi:iron(III) transport system permease protein